MNNKDLCIIGGVSVVTIITTGILYLVKTKDKNGRRLKEDMEIIGASLEEKGWWLTKECQTRSLEIIEWVKVKAKDDEEIKKALEVIREKHWMTKDYQTAFKTIYDWAKTKI